jgi:hypothetical protein
VSAPPTEPERLARDLYVWVIDPDGTSWAGLTREVQWAWRQGANFVLAREARLRAIETAARLAVEEVYTLGEFALPLRAMRRVSALRAALDREEGT